MKAPLTKNVGNRYPCEELSMFNKIRESVCEFIFEASISLRKNQDGKPVGFCGIIRDITGRKIAEKQLSNMLAMMN
jgi:PAS domain S-box-containing protein